MLRRKLTPLWLLFFSTLLLPLSACGSTQVLETRRLPTELLAPCLNLGPLRSTETQRALAVDVVESTPDQIACRNGAEAVLAAERAQ